MIDHEYEATETFRGHTIASLRTAFNKIQNPTNWKLPFGAIVPVRELDRYDAAAVFFAGCTLEVLYTEPESFGPDRNCAVKGAGYYASVGA